MNGRDITQLGYREGSIVGLALRVAKRAIKRMPRAEVDEKLRRVLADPDSLASDPLFGALASELIKERDRPYWIEREAPAPYRTWGEGLEKGAVDQMNAALPRWFQLFLGVAEIAASIGLILPGLTRIMPSLVVAAAVGIMIVLSSATVYHLVRSEFNSALITLVMFVMTSSLAYGRWRVLPIRPRHLA
jgi:uncharacterized membrane protein YphA (DoxX/SURF4 family)